MAKMSRDKGARGEREVAALLRSRGITAERGVQRDGSKGSPDVKSEFDDWLHIEVKRVEAFKLYPSLAQATEEAREGKVPCVFHRRRGEEWVVVLKAQDFIDLILDLADKEVT